MSEVKQGTITPPSPQVAHRQPKAMRVLAEIVSFICHPVFMPLFMSYMIYKLCPASFTGIPQKIIGQWFLNIGYNTIFIPLVGILLMKPLGFIGSFKMATARERTIPLLLTMTFYFWVSHVFNSIPDHVPLAWKVLLLGNFWGIILVFLVNIFTKISMHTAAAGSMLGILIVLMILSPVNLLVPFFVALIIAGIIGTARMVLGAHQRGDVWLGYIIGILVQLGAYVYFKVI
jgi:hypothetical protein